MTTRRETGAEDAPRVVVERLVSLACLAPSVHNTQPWLWRHDQGTLELYADLRLRLPAEDPFGRNLIISCGAALHHLQVAAHSLGWETAVDRLPAEDPSGALARIEVFRTAPHDMHPGEIDLMRARCTDRRPFTEVPVTAERLEQLCQRAGLWDAHAEAVMSEDAQLRLESLMNRPIGYDDLEGQRRGEQDRWIDHQGLDGIPRTLLPENQGPLRAVSRFPSGVLEDAGGRTLHGGERVILVGGDKDDVASWLRTGEATSDIWLEASRAGMSVIPMTHLMEVENTRREVARTILSADFEPHLILRVGWQADGRDDLPRTHRRPLTEVLLK